MDSGLSIDTESGTVRLVLTRPDTRNSLTQAVCTALREGLTAAAADPRCRVVVIQGSGGSFASGADLVELDSLRDRPELLVAAYRNLRATQELLYTLDRPTLAAIDGHCIGAGLSLALACDLRIATSRSAFAAPPARLGLAYSDPEIRRLALRVGTARTRDLLFTGRRIDAAEALTLGLIERLGTAAELDALVRECVDGFAACSASALRKAKRQILALEQCGQPGGQDDTLAENAFFEPDGIEGMTAFLERRKPRFAG